MLILKNVHIHGPASPENRGFRMNLAFVVGKNAVAVIETGYNEAMATEMLAHIARITSAPVKYAINRVYGGDVLYSGRLPAVVDGGNVASWIQVFDGLSRFGAVTFVPGHGKPAKLDAFRFPTREYLVALRDHMKKMIDTGVDMQDAIDQLDQSRFAKLDNYEELARRNASFAYREAEAASFK